MIQIRVVSGVEKFRDPSFDFKSCDTDWGVHGIHPYPAMMIYPIARRLLLEFTKKEDTVLDPFMGSGTVLVESLLNERYGIGIDINPLAILLARVKTTPIKISLLEDNLHQVLSREAIEKSAKRPEFFNLEFWFKDKITKDLARLLNQINLIEEEKIQSFFKVAFSETVRLCSNTNAGEFKLVRKKDFENHNPDVFRVFEKISLKNIRKLQETYLRKLTTRIKIYERDTRYPLPIKPESVNLILTSPPYGDSKTTVAYGQFSRLSLQWLGYEKVNIDNESLGGNHRNYIENDLPSLTLKKILPKIRLKDEKRAREVLAFYKDFNKCLESIYDVLKVKGIICFVLGNRRVAQTTIPTDRIVLELSQEFGLSHIKTITRSIPSKRMPTLNSPTNITGRTETTMNFENIIILQKSR